MNIVQQEKLNNPKLRISLACAILLALLAVIIAITVLSTLELSHPTTVLGPGFYPLSISILMFLSCLYIIYSLLYGDRDSVVIKSALDVTAFKKPIVLFVLAIACVAAMPLLGFIGSMFLFSYVYMTFMEQKKQPLLWRLVHSAAISGGVFLLFKALQVYLPVPFWL